ncbi:hypothetical protein ACFQVA_00325 [Actinomadura keratinilytica]
MRLHADGALEWLGRTDAQLKVRAHRVEPAEIEGVLERFPGVGAAVVTAARFEGRGEPRLTAYLLGAETATRSELDAWARGSLPDHMVPDAYVRLDALPLTGNGKTARSLLPEPTRDTIIRTDEAPSPATAVAAETAAAPRRTARPCPDSQVRSPPPSPPPWAPTTSRRTPTSSTSAVTRPTSPSPPPA